MVLRGPVVALVLLGVVPAVLWPAHAGTVAALWLAGVVLLVLLDVVLTPPPGTVALTRSPDPQVRLHEPTTTTLTLTNAGGRRLRGLVRDDELTDAGRALREGVEEATDRLVAPAVDALGERLDDVVNRLEGWAEQVVASGWFPPDPYKRAAG